MLGGRKTDWRKLELIKRVFSVGYVIAWERLVPTLIHAIGKAWQKSVLFFTRRSGNFCCRWSFCTKLFSKKQDPLHIGIASNLLIQRFSAIYCWLILNTAKINSWLVLCTRKPAISSIAAIFFNSAKVNLKLLFQKFFDIGN